MAQRLSPLTVATRMLALIALIHLGLASLPANAFAVALAPAKVEADDVNTDAGRHQLGVAFLKQNKPREAAEVLSKISDGYRPLSALTEARWWWSLAAMRILDEKITDKEKQQYQEQFLRALEGIPEPDTKERGEIVRFYVQERLQLGTVL